MSPVLAEAASLAGASWPYRQAAQLLARLCGAQISAEEIRLLTNRQGRERAELQQQEACRPPAARASQSDGPTTAQADRSIIGLDGGWVPSREQRGGMEGKVAVVATNQVLVREARHPSKGMTWYELAKYMRHHRHPSVKRSRFVTRRYAATFASSSAIGQQAALELERLGIAQQGQVVVADGATWIKKEAQKHFAEATCILDWPHLWRTMIKAVRAVARSREADQTWVREQSSKASDYGKGKWTRPKPSCVAGRKSNKAIPPSTCWMKH